MDARELLAALSVGARLKDTTRHCYTAAGRHESVAEHSWLMTLMAFFMKDELPEVDMDKVIKMCIIHDLGEAFTGDIPTFEKTQADEESEETLLYRWVETLPPETAREMRALYGEMEKRESAEARVYKAIDGMEALIQHNLSDLSTWTAHERELNLTYAYDRVAFSKYLTAVRDEIKKDTQEKLAAEQDGQK